MAASTDHWLLYLPTGFFTYPLTMKRPAQYEDNAEAVCVLCAPEEAHGGELRRYREHGLLCRQHWPDKWLHRASTGSALYRAMPAHPELRLISGRTAPMEGAALASLVHSFVLENLKKDLRAQGFP